MLTRLRAAPITAPTLLAVAVFLAWTPLDGGQPITRWAPGALVLLALLGLALVALPPLRWSTLPGTVRVAALALGAFTAWSFLSIALGRRRRRRAGRARTARCSTWWPSCCSRCGRSGRRRRRWVLGLWTFGLGAIAIVTLRADRRGRRSGDAL